MAMRISGFASIVAMVVFASIWASTAIAAECGDDQVRSAHAIAMHGDPKYAESFPHFDYVDPDAPKGGTLRQGALGTFDSFNPWIPKGNAVSTGAVESLLVGNEDEPLSLYGLIAERIEWPGEGPISLSGPAANVFQAVWER